MTTITLKPAYPDHLNAGERKVIDALILDAIAAGCDVSVYDGEEWAIWRSTDYTAITKEVAATDITTILVREAEGYRRADFMFVHGNLPSEVLADMTDTPFARKIAARADTIAKQLEAEGN